MRRPGFEPGSPAWKAGVLATGPTPQVEDLLGAENSLEFSNAAELQKVPSS